LPASPLHHVAGGFRNPPGSPESGGESGEWAAFLLRHLIVPNRGVTLPAGHVLTAAESRAGLEALARGEGIMWLGLASFLMRLGGRWIVTDPYLSAYASPVQGLGPRRYAPVPLALDELPPIDLVLLSHNHYDHLDLPTLRFLAEANRPAVITALGVGRYLQGLPFRELRELDWLDATDLGELSITCTPAIHFSKRSLFDANETLWCGFMASAGGRTVYFAADTAYGPVFAKDFAELPAPDMALLPIGAYEPRRLMRGVHCTPEEAVQIARDIGARRICGMHWGTIRLTDEPPFEPPARFRAAAHAAGYAEDAIHLPPIGGTVAL
jgi:N-acyl-phosphatidylethanolamine-hydrolysing phospholipase D